MTVIMDTTRSYIVRLIYPKSKKCYINTSNSCFLGEFPVYDLKESFKNKDKLKTKSNICLVYPIKKYINKEISIYSFGYFSPK